MTLPLFIQVGDRLINLALCEHVAVEDDTLSFSTGSETVEVEFKTEPEARAALGQIQQILQSKNLLLGKAL
jgi:hypothetical protein